MTTNSLAWVLQAPRETLSDLSESRISHRSAVVNLSFALLSGALAESLLSQGVGLPVPAMIFMVFIGAGFHLYFMNRLSTLFGGPTLPWSRWVHTSSVAFLPLHLLLPAALVCKALPGVVGIALYELFKVVIYLALLRRWSWGVESMNHWPSWAAMLLVLSPLLIGALTILLVASMMLVIMGMLLLGAFRA